MERKEKYKKFNDFFESFVNCKESQKYLQEGEISIKKEKKKKKKDERKEKEVEEVEKEEKNKKRNIEKKLKEQFERLKNIENEEKNKIPITLQTLLKLQSNDGRWFQLEEVLNCLSLPNQRYFQQFDEWEEATIFALSEIRQFNHLFHLLGDLHDKAITWITSTNFIRQATEIRINYQIKQSSSSSSSSSSNNLLKQQQTLNSSITKNFPSQIQHDSYKKLLEQSSRFNYSRTFSSKNLQNNDKNNNSEQFLLLEIEEQRKKLAKSLLNPSVQFQTFLSHLLEVQQQIEHYEVNSLFFPFFLTTFLTQIFYLERSSSISFKIGSSKRRSSGLY